VVGRRLGGRWEEVGRRLVDILAEHVGSRAFIYLTQA
jgi:hypothetical protein